MIFKYNKYLIFACFLLMASHSTAEENRFNEAIIKVYFSQQPSFSTGKLKFYSKIPDSKKVIQIKNYEWVIDSFYWWLQRVLKSQYIPPRAFVDKHIKLVPAERGNTKEDLAFLAYKIKNETFMIVQSGGMNSSIIIFLNNPSQKILQESSQGLILAQSFIKKYCSKTLNYYIPGFTSTKKTPEGYIATGKSIFSIKNFNYAWCFMSGSDICLYAKKEFLVDGLPPRSPSSNKWFSILKNLKLKKGKQ